VTEADQGWETGRLLVEYLTQQGLRFVDPAQLSQLVGDLDLGADGVRAGGDSGLESREGTGMIAAAAQHVPEAD
jgi:hypothetical protein